MLTCKVSGHFEKKEMSNAIQGRTPQILVMTMEFGAYI